MENTSRNNYYSANKLFKMRWLGLLTVIFVIFITIGYSANNTQLNISGEAFVRIDQDIRVTACSLNSVTNSGYETYSSEYFKDSVKIGVTLPELTSTVTYDVTVTNFVSISMTISSITEVIWNHSDMEYVLSGIALGDEIAGTSNTTFQITFKYKTGTSPLPAITSLGSHLRFNFAEFNDKLDNSIVTGGGGTYGEVIVAHAKMNDPTESLNIDNDILTQEFTMDKSSPTSYDMQTRITYTNSDAVTLTNGSVGLAHNCNTAMASSSATLDVATLPQSSSGIVNVYMNFNTKNIVTCRLTATLQYDDGPVTRYFYYHIDIVK